MEFGNLISRSFEIAWRHKSLWFFGLFVGGSSYLNLDTDDFFQIDQGNFQDFSDMPIHLNPSLVGPLVLFLGFFILMGIAISLISSAAIIDGVNKITRGGVYTFASSFSRGLDFFWRMLGMLVFVIFVMVVFVLAGVLLAAVMGWFSVLLIFPGSLILIFIVAHVFGLGKVALVVRDCSVGDALAEGWSLLKRHLGNVVIITLIYIALAIGFGLVALVVGLATFLPLNAFLAGAIDNFGMKLLVGLILALPISLVLGGYLGTFFEALYTQFYFRLVEPASAHAQPYPPTPPETTA